MKKSKYDATVRLERKHLMSMCSSVTEGAGSAKQGKRDYNCNYVYLHF